MSYADKGQLLHHNPVTGLTSFWLENGDGNYMVYEEQDAEPIVDLAHALATETRPGLELRHIGEIPLPFFDQARAEGWLEDPVAWRRFLDNHNRFKVHKW